MRMSLPIPRLDIRTLKFRVKRSFARSKRVTGTRACYIGLPRKLWDRIILFLFSGCLFIFFHALLGFGIAGGDLRASNDTFVQQVLPSISPPRNRGYVALKRDQKMRPQAMSRVMVDWHGNYEILPMTAAVVSPAAIPQYTFPDPTPGQVTMERGRALDQATITDMATLVDVPFRFYATPYDPFRLVFEGSDKGDEYRGRYPVAGSPRITALGARTRRFGRCTSGEACL